MKLCLCGRPFCYKIPWRLSFCDRWNWCSRNYRSVSYIMEMILWVVLVYLMAVVMGRGHGGDGVGEPPPPGGCGDDWWRAHKLDFPRKKTRGKAKNLALRRQVDNTGRPVDLPFDEEATCMPVGKLGGNFVREEELYMWRKIPFDMEGWKNVDRDDNNKLMEHMSGIFNLKNVEEDIVSKNKK